MGNSILGLNNFSQFFGAKSGGRKTGGAGIDIFGLLNPGSGGNNWNNMFDMLSGKSNKPAGLGLMGSIDVAGILDPNGTGYATKDEIAMGMLNAVRGFRPNGTALTQRAFKL